LQKHGYGLFLDKGLRFEALFENDKMTGVGKITYPNGDYYLGGLDKLFKHGNGKLVSKNEVFEGQFRQNLKDGVGFTFFSDGRVHQGQYRQDKQEGQGEWFSKLKQGKNPMKIDYYAWEQTKDRVYKVC
jgi:hypothetical protein